MDWQHRGELEDDVCARFEAMKNQRRPTLNDMSTPGGGLHEFFTKEGTHWWRSTVRL